MSAATTAEESVVAMVGARFSGTPSLPDTLVAPPEYTLGAERFEFDEEFQTKVATHCVRDLEFMRKVGHLVKPEYFENLGEAAIVNMAQRFYQKYRSLPNAVTMKELFKEDLTAKIITADVKPVAAGAFRVVYQSDADLGNSDFYAEKVATFARHQAMSQTILNSVDWLTHKKFDKIETAVKAACNVGINSDGEEYDYYARIGERTQKRSDRRMGIGPPTGVTTGLLKLDELLYHKGWGKKELSVILGGAKSGKTTALINFAKAASLAGKNVLYVTLEVAAEIISDRLDASITDTEIKLLLDRMHDVKTKVEAITARSGALKIHEYPSGTFTPSQLEALIERYKSPVFMPDGTIRPAIQFDMVVVDYADIMAPDHRTNDPIENSKSVWLALRAIAFKENVAMLSATQGNREGARSTVLKAEHIADDYNKVRTVDILISINITDEERAASEARLYFAASRNQEGGFTIFIKQNLAKMKFIESIVRVE